MFDYLGKNSAYAYQEEPEKGLEDQSMIYIGLINTAKYIIAELKSNGINTTLEEGQLANAQELVSRENNSVIQKDIDRNNENSKKNIEDKLRYNYSGAITYLKELINRLKLKREDYYRITNKLEKINNILNQADDTDFDDIINSLLESLKELRTIPKYLDSKNEDEIIKRMYSIIFRVMKLEILYTDKRRLLDEIKKDETDTEFVVEALLEEIKNLDNKDIKNLVTAIKSKGLDIGLLLDENLILLIAALQNPETIPIQIEEYKLNNKKMKELNDKISQTEEEKKNHLEELDSAKKKASRKTWKFRYEIAKFILNGLLFTAGGIGSFLGAEKVSRTPMYYTTVTTYDSSTGTTTVSKPGYTKDAEEREILVIKLDSWGEEDNKYKRKKYEFRVGEPYEIFDNPEDYLKYKFLGGYGIETSKETPEDYGTYGDNKYIVIMTEKDIENSKTGRNPLLYKIVLISSLTGVIGLEIIDLKKKRIKSYTAAKNELKYAIEEKDTQDKLVEQFQNELNDLNDEKKSLSELIKKEEAIVSRYTDESGEIKPQFTKKRTT